jgi:hypothetical protein
MEREGVGKWLCLGSLRGRADRLQSGGIPAGLLLLGALPLLLYSPVLHDFFALDDFIWLSQARTPDLGDFLRRAVSFPPAGATEIYTPFWRPLIDVYFFTAWRLFGLDPLPYRVINVALHGVAGVLTALLARQVLHSWRAGLMAGGLFVLLPTYDFAVAWISDITELLGACWYLLALTSYVGFLRGGAHARRLYLGALGALALGLLTKESTATLPATLALVTLAVQPLRSRQQFLGHARALAPFAGLVAAYGGFLLWNEYRVGADTGLYRFGQHAFANLWDYLQRLALPLRDTDPALTVPRQVLALAFLAGGLVAFALRRWVVVFAVLWTLLALLPYSFFVAGIEYRYTYLAAVPFTICWVAIGQAALGVIANVVVRPVLAAGALSGLMLLALLLGGEARHRQRWLSTQADAYARLFHEVPVQCGTLAPGSEIYLLDDPVWDYYGVSSGVALSFHYQAVRVHRGPGAAERLLSAGDRRCVLRYRDGQYTRTVSQ